MKIISILKKQGILGLLICPYDYPDLKWMFENSSGLSVGLNVKCSKGKLKKKVISGMTNLI